MNRDRLVIAIDGPSGAGKSTLARLLAKRLGYVYIDTGAMYRSVGWKAVQEGIDPADEQRLAELCSRLEISIRSDGKFPRFFVNGVEVTGEIRSPEMGMTASAVSKVPAVRERLLVLQRDLGRDGGVVMDGRDIGTVVFPGADVKIYLDASPAERGRRRYRELMNSGRQVDLEKITREIEERDRQDSSRSIAPLRRADDAVLIDTDGMTIEAVLDAMLSLVGAKKAAR